MQVDTTPLAETKLSATSHKREQAWDEFVQTLCKCKVTHRRPFFPIISLPQNAGNVNVIADLFYKRCKILCRMAWFVYKAKKIWYNRKNKR